MPATALTSLEKKRARDRRAQNARRARHDATIRSLEEVADHCHQNHEQIEETSKVLRATIEALQVENARLRSQHAAVISILSDQAASPLAIDAVHAVELTAIDKATSNRSPAEQFHPDYKLISRHHVDDPLVETLMPWLQYPALIANVHDEPTGDDLLYGSQTNPLANAIHVALVCARFGTIAEVERLAIGWLMYVYTKWLFDPTPAHFARLPAYLRPTKLQQDRAHSAMIDIVLWPEVRDNFIHHFESPGDLLEALRTLAPELHEARIPRSPLLEPDPNRPGNLRIKAAFIESFSDLDNWKTPTSLGQRYPELLLGTQWSSEVDS